MDKRWQWYVVMLLLWQAVYAAPSNIDLGQLDRTIEDTKKISDPAQRRKSLDKVFDKTLIKLNDRYRTLKSQDVISFNGDHFCASEAFKLYMVDLGTVAMDAQSVFEKYADVMNQDDKIFLWSLKDEMVTFAQSRVKRAYEHWKG